MSHSAAACTRPVAGAFLRGITRKLKKHIKHSNNNICAASSRTCRASSTSPAYGANRDPIPYTNHLKPYMLDLMTATKKIETREEHQICHPQCSRLQRPLYTRASALQRHAAFVASMNHQCMADSTSAFCARPMRQTGFHPVPVVAILCQCTPRHEPATVRPSLRCPAFGDPC